MVMAQQFKCWKEIIAVNNSLKNRIFNKIETISWVVCLAYFFFVLRESLFFGTKVFDTEMEKKD